MIDVTCTLSPPMADATLPQTSVEATTFTWSPVPPPAPEPVEDVLEHAPSANTAKADAAARTLVVRREVIGHS
ncbi:hypothetical protein GCM10009565_04110 [Amycolatopsis albidoflavus]